MSEIRKLINGLEQAVMTHAWQRCIEGCFRVLYGMPEVAQRTLVASMMRRYVPIFHMHWPTITWPEEILDQPELWVAQHDRALPQEPASANSADASFLFAFDALLNGLQHRADRTVLTSSYVAAVNAAINARGINVWMADDPEAVVLWETQGYFPGRSVTENLAAIAVIAREWQIVIDWIAEEQHSQLFVTGDPNQTEQALNRWKDHELSLIIRERDAPNKANAADR
jgi:hypothetical protein